VRTALCADAVKVTRALSPSVVLFSTATGNAVASVGPERRVADRDSPAESADRGEAPPQGVDN